MEHELFILKRNEGFKLELPTETLIRIVERNATDDEAVAFSNLREASGSSAKGWISCDKKAVTVGFGNCGVLISELEAIQILGPHRRHVYV